MKFENTEVFNLQGAIRGMRNPLESWSKSDSYIEGCTGFERFIIGEKDLDLAKRLIKAGSEHRKFLRQVMVSVDITAPIFWWKEFDTYKINTTSNSTSTMHKLATTPITLNCFETDDYEDSLKIFDREPYNYDKYLNECVEQIIDICETLRQRYLETNDKRYWKELIRWLPESWLQTRTITMNYENIFNMYHQRKNHKLTEWNTFCEWAKTLPYTSELIFGDELDD